ncbi:hypothetical protein M8494_11790 [Serratia ureilytica]
MTLSGVRVGRAGQAAGGSAAAGGVDAGSVIIIALRSGAGQPPAEPHRPPAGAGGASGQPLSGSGDIALAFSTRLLGDAAGRTAGAAVCGGGDATEYAVLMLLSAEGVSVSSGTIAWRWGRCSIRLAEN